MLGGRIPAARTSHPPPAASPPVRESRGRGADQRGRGGRIIKRISLVAQPPARQRGGSAMVGYGEPAVPAHGVLRALSPGGADSVEWSRSMSGLEEAS